MQIKLYATFRSIAGTRSLDLDLSPGTTAYQAVVEVLQQVPALRPHWMNDNGEIHAHVHGFINGQEIPTLEQGWDTPLMPSDEMDFIPPVAGG